VAGGDDSTRPRAILDQCYDHNFWRFSAIFRFAFLLTGAALKDITNQYILHKNSQQQCYDFPTSLYPGANPTISNYNASALKNTTQRIALRVFRIKNIFRTLKIL
jgi:hypothetical protein